MNEQPKDAQMTPSERRERKPDANPETPGMGPGTPPTTGPAGADSPPLLSNELKAEGLGPRGELFLSLQKKLKDLAAKLLVDVGEVQPVLERARQKPRVLIVGEFNTGKSSLVNSAMGEVLLPTGVTPTTSLLTSIEHGPFQVRVKPIGAKDLIKIDPGKKEAAGYGIPDFTFDWDGFRALLTDPKKIEQIERVEISHPAAPSEITIIDSPGINDIAKSRAEIVYGMIPNADMVLFVISALKPFAESERQFLEEKLLAGDLKKLLFVLNRIDEIDADEREELVNETQKLLTEAVNKAYARVNTALGQTLYLPVEKVDLFVTSAKEIVPISGEKRSKTIGFSTPTPGEKQLADGNRRLWSRVMELGGRGRDAERDALFHHFLRRGSLRIAKTLDVLADNRSNDRTSVFKRLGDDSLRIGKLRDSLKSAERRIKAVEADLKMQFSQQVEKVFTDLTGIMRLQRDPGTVNARLKDLYEYITVRMKTTLDQLYAELGREFDAVIDDRQFMEERSLSVQFDLSDVPSKIMSSFSFAYIAAIFFGGSIGMIAGAAYFASQIIANKRSVKEYFLSATVSEETLLEAKRKLLEGVNREVEYAVDYVRQSLVQRIDVIQSDLRHQVYVLQRPLAIDLDTARRELDEIKVGVNGFLAS